MGDPYASIPIGLAFDPAAFVKAVASVSNPGAYGNAGRNILTGPSYQNVDAALAKSARIGRLGLQFRVEAFNVLNHANYQLPVFLLDNSNVGRHAATANEAREWQLAVDLLTAGRTPLAYVYLA